MRSLRPYCPQTERAVTCGKDDVRQSVQAAASDRGSASTFRTPAHQKSVQYNLKMSRAPLCLHSLKKSQGYLLEEPWIDSNSGEKLIARGHAKLGRFVKETKFTLY